ncbi:PP2C family protein-serine/threonine phosphatase [Pseudodesulfovibrio sp.]|uniref:PP2C family protein-serine/threonine phosphatase n=1 Tax=unclassified Pseudodesulfovibrio TaxID=2661612 RepID=UPI003AFFA72C
MSVLINMVRGVCDWSVERKMTTVLLLGIVLPPLASFVVLETRGEASATRFLAMLSVGTIILFVPVAKWLSHFIALRSIRELNAQCQLLKEGNYEQVDLPPAEREGHDFLELQRNMHWMGYTIATREHKLQHAMDDLTRAQRQIGQSLKYASLIQKSFLPDRNDLRDFLPDHFLIWEQRDTVGGDAYWVRPTENGFFIGVIDCTGHGVPGAFMTLIVASLLDKAAGDGEESPAAVLGRMNRLIKDSLGQTNREAPSDDGMDCGLCHVSRNGPLFFAGANTPLYLLDREGARVIKGDRCGLGYVRSDPDFSFTDIPVSPSPDMRFYLASDGLTDQVGGDLRIPFGKRRFMTFMERERETPLSAQGVNLLAELAAYQGTEIRRDDVTVIGFKL